MAKVLQDRKAEAEQEDVWGDPLSIPYDNPVGDSLLKRFYIGVRDNLDLPALMERQRTALRLKQYAPLGILKRVTFIETSDEAVNDPTNPLVEDRKQYLHLDWLGVGPLIGMGNDQKDVLIEGSLPEPPLVPNPNHSPHPVLDRDMIVGLRAQGYSWATIARDLGSSEDEVQQAASLPKRGTLWPETPKVKQDIRHRSYGRILIKNEVWECFQPISQIEVFSADHQGFLYLNYMDVQGNFRSDPMGRIPALMWNLATRRAHFVYGTCEVELPPLN